MEQTPLKVFRLKHRIKLVEIAKASQLDLSLLSKYENGWKELTRVEHIGLLVEAYQGFDLDVIPTLKKMGAFSRDKYK